MTDSPIGLAQVLAHVAPDFVESLSPVERFVLAGMHSAWLRLDQKLPISRWRSALLLAGRGFGKTHVIGVHINEAVSSGRVSTHPEQGIALVAPNEDRTEAVQIATLISTAPPWFKPERYAGGLIWPNGARAHAFTAKEPGRPRGGNFEISWLTEVVDWSASTRWLAYTNTTSATRRGLEQVIIDTTAMGRNEVIEHALAECARDPVHNLLLRGTTFDNPLLSAAYLQSECSKYSGRRLLEELFGQLFLGNAGAGWTQDQIDALRVQVAPPLARVLVSVDPAQSDAPDADETGIVAAGADAQPLPHFYCVADESGRYAPAEWGRRVVALALRWRAIGVFVERNKLGQHATHPIEVACQQHNPPIEVRMLDRGDAFPPFAPPSVLYIKSAQTSETKLTRADGPAALTDAGRVHHVGNFTQLEGELTTYDGSGKSPNRYDAFNYSISELAGLGRDAPANGRAAVSGAAALNTSLLDAFRGSGRNGIGL